MENCSSTAERQESWQDAVRKGLVQVFQDNVEDLCRILHYLDEEDKTYRYSDRIPAVWGTLKTALGAGEALFKRYAEKLAQDTRSAERDPDFRKAMHDLYDGMLSVSDQPMNDDYGHDFEMLVANRELVVSGTMGFARTWPMIPAASQAQILEMLPKLVTNRMALSAVDELAGLVSKVGGNVVMVGLATIYLTYEAYRNIRRWWNGEISGKRCAKNIIDATVSMAGGMSGGVAGAAAGAFIGPIGMLGLGIGGSVLGCWLAGAVSDWLTQHLFGIPKEEALENAYNYLGVQMVASNVDINSAYRRLCLQHHPDKGGSKEEFFKLQNCMGVIKVSRGDEF